MAKHCTITNFDFKSVRKFEVIECVTQEGYIQTYMAKGNLFGFERINSMVKESPDLKNMQAKEFKHVELLTVLNEY